MRATIGVQYRSKFWRKHFRLTDILNHCIATEELSNLCISFVLHNIFRQHPGDGVVERVKRTYFLKRQLWVRYGGPQPLSGGASDKSGAMMPLSRVYWEIYTPEYILSLIHI